MSFSYRVKIMAMLVLDRSDLEVRYVDGSLAMYAHGLRSGTVPVALLDRVIIQGARTRIDCGVLTKLAEAGVPVLLLNARLGRQVAIVLGPAHNDAAVRLAQSRRVFDHAFCDEWARMLVIAKLRRQHRFIREVEALRPERRKVLRDARVGVANALAEIDERPDTTCPRLRGLEGSAARAYFGGYASLFAPNLAFSGRNRRPPRDPVNACLSLAYTLLHFDAVRAAHVAGLDPLLGFYHRSAFGRESLACDLIEPLRPHVDRWLWMQFRGGNLRAEHFTRGNGACLLGKAGREHFYTEWSRFVTVHRRWLRQRCSSLARRLRNEGEPMLVRFEELEEYL
jgi:CRISPR-associated protein Cas1